MHLLSVRSLKKTFNHDSLEIPILKSISYTFNQEKTYVLTGPSGAGKSTFLNLLAGLDTPTQGSICFDDQDINTLTTHQKNLLLQTKIGLIFQYAHLIKELSVLENVIIKGFFNSNNDALEQRAQELLTDMGLKSKIHKYPPILSAGEQQRVAIARALLIIPAFLIADEPTCNLDQKTGADILDILIDYQKSYKIGLIFSSHDIHLIKRFNNHLYLEHGHLREESK